MDDPHVAFEACFNFRDLGGYETLDGRRVRSGVVYRSGTLHRLSSADLELARRLGLRTVIDLRTTGELERLGAYGGNGIAFHHAPLFEEDAGPFGSLTRDTPEPPAGLGYFVMAKTGAPAIAFVLRAIATEELAVVFHSAAGKDRTGVVAAILLSALGVPDETIVLDYQLSDDALAPTLAWAQHHAPELVDELESYPPWLLKARPAVIEGFLGRLHDAHGSIEGYLGAIGIGPDMLCELRTRLLT